MKHAKGVTQWVVPATGVIHFRLRGDSNYLCGIKPQESHRRTILSLGYCRSCLTIYLKFNRLRVSRRRKKK